MMSWYNNGYDSANFSELVGKTIVSIGGMAQHSDLVVIECSDGSKYIMEHHQDCCEHVYLEDVNGDVADLLNRPVTLTEVSIGDSPYGHEPDSDSSETWTFYRLATDKGWVVLRWSEGVSFEKLVGSSNATIPAPLEDDWAESWSSSY